MFKHMLRTNFSLEQISPGILAKLLGRISLKVWFLWFSFLMVISSDGLKFEFIQYEENKQILQPPSEKKPPLPKIGQHPNPNQLENLWNLQPLSKKDLGVQLFALWNILKETYLNILKPPVCKSGDNFSTISSVECPFDGFNAQTLLQPYG